MPSQVNDDGTVTYWAVGFDSDGSHSSGEIDGGDPGSAGTFHLDGGGVSEPRTAKRSESKVVKAQPEPAAKEPKHAEVKSRSKK